MSKLGKEVIGLLKLQDEWQIDEMSFTLTHKGTQLQLWIASGWGFLRIRGIEYYFPIFERFWIWFRYVKPMIKITRNRQNVPKDHRQVKEDELLESLRSYPKTSEEKMWSVLKKDFSKDN